MDYRKPKTLAGCWAALVILALTGSFTPYCEAKVSATTQPATPLPGSSLSVADAVRDGYDFVAICQAMDEAWVQIGKLASPDAVQTFTRPEKPLAGKIAARSKTLRVGYSLVDVGGRREQPIKKGQRVIWIARGRGKSCHGVKAVLDTPANRQAVAAAAKEANEEIEAAINALVAVLGLQTPKGWQVTLAKGQVHPQGLPKAEGVSISMEPKVAGPGKPQGTFLWLMSSTYRVPQRILSLQMAFWRGRRVLYRSADARMPSEVIRAALNATARAPGAIDVQRRRPGVYVAGKWRYVLERRGLGSRGALLYMGISIHADFDRLVRTPWGYMRNVPPLRTMRGPSGWLPLGGFDRFGFRARDEFVISFGETKIDAKASRLYVSGPWAYFSGCLTCDGKAVPVPKNVGDYYVTPWGKIFWTGRRSLWAVGYKGKAGKELPPPASLLRPELFRFQFYPKDNAKPGLWVVDFYPTQDHPGAKAVYKRAVQLPAKLRNKITPFELVGRLKGVYSPKDRIAAVSYTRVGDKLTARISYVNGRARRPADQSVYFLAAVPKDLPPGDYTAEVTVVEYVQQADRLVPVGLGKAIESLTCTFTVPRLQAALARPTTQPASKPSTRAAERAKALRPGQIFFPVVVTTQGKRGSPRGYVDIRGRMVVPPQFAQAWALSDGLACVMDFQGYYAYLDRNGKKVLQTKFYNFNQEAKFSEGLARFYRKRKWGFFNKKGEIVVEARFDEVMDFSEGHAAVRTGWPWGFIDSSGNLKIKPRFGWVRSFSQGLAQFCVYRNHAPFAGYIDKTGRIVIPAIYERTKAFSDNLAAVMIRGQGKWGYIDKTGKSVIKAEFEDALPFSQGLAGVAKPARGIAGGRWGFIDTRGKYAIASTYEKVRPFSEGLAAVKTNGKWGFIDKRGKMVVKAEFDDVGSHARGVALGWVKQGGRSAAIERDGRITWIWDQSRRSQGPGIRGAREPEDGQVVGHGQ